MGNELIPICIFLQEIGLDNHGKIDVCPVSPVNGVRMHTNDTPIMTVLIAPFVFCF